MLRPTRSADIDNNGIESGGLTLGSRLSMMATHMILLALHSSLHIIVYCNILLTQI